MKPTAKSTPELAPLLAFGAHPDDIEFGCGGVIARETRAGRRGALGRLLAGRVGHARHARRADPARRGRAARLLGATLEFVKLDGDASLEAKAAHALRLAAIIRRVRPGIVLAPTPRREPAPRPSAPRAGWCATPPGSRATAGWRGSAARPAHAIGPLLYYAAGPEAEPDGELPVLIDISDPRVVASWTAAMRAHASQLATPQLRRAAACPRAGAGAPGRGRLRAGALSERPARVRVAFAPGPRGAALLTWSPAARSRSGSRAIPPSAEAASSPRRWARSWPAAATRRISSATSAPSGFQRTRRASSSIPS